MKTKDTENPGLSEAQDQVIEHWKSANQSHKNTHEAIWKCGQALCRVRDKLPTGKFKEWLESEGIPKSTAYRWMEFSEGYKFDELGKVVSVTQGLKALALPRRKRKEPAKEVEPKGETEGEAPSVEKAEVTDGKGTPPLPVEDESAQEIQELRDKLRETEDQLREAEEKLRKTEKELREANEKIAELSGDKKAVEGLHQKNDHKKRIPKEREPAGSTSVGEKQIRLHSSLSGKSENPESGKVRTEAEPVSR